MKKRLSSIIVPIYKLIPIFVFADAIYWIFQDSRNLIKPGFIFLLLFGGVWYLITFRWKRVYLEGDTLYVSNYLKTIKVHLNEIADVEASSLWGWQPQTITVSLNTESRFGNQIIYVPRGLGLHAKPFADELRSLLTSKSN